MDNFLLAVYMAMANDQQSMTSQQQADANGTMLNVRMEEQIYKNQTDDGGPMQNDENEVIKYVELEQTASGSDMTKDQGKVNQWQTQFTADQAKAQAAEQRADSNVQTTQNQTGQDSTNLQQKTQLAQALNDLGSMLASLLSNRY